jgi:hypothetical protein
MINFSAIDLCTKHSNKNNVSDLICAWLQIIRRMLMYWDVFARVSRTIVRVILYAAREKKKAVGIDGSQVHEINCSTFQ